MRRASDHECVKFMQKALAERNTFLGVNETMNFTTGEESDALLIQVSKINTRKPWTKFVPCKFCPWCGGDIYQPKRATQANTKGKP
jgi:hypothetical protein